MSKQQSIWLLAGMQALLFIFVSCSSANDDKKDVKKSNPQETRLSASHILVIHNEAKRTPPEISRTKKEALARINEALKKIKDGAEFAALAKEYSDCPSKVVGGNLGIFPASKNSKEFTDALLALEYGQVSDPVETAYGYHVLKRQKAMEINVRHIMISHDEVKLKSPTRSKQEAMILINKIQKMLQDKGGDFANLAKKYSDCSSKNAGGNLGLITPGKMMPAFEKVAFTLKENEISDVVETEYGYHIIQRLP